MKRILIIATLIASTFTLKAQDFMKPDVPSEVTSALEKKFPESGSQKVDWDKEGSNFKAEFEMQQRGYEVLFDAKGTWISTEIEGINVSELPDSARKQLNTGEYSTWDIDKVMVKENADEVIYEVEMEKGLKEKELYFDKKGNQVKKRS